MRGGLHLSKLVGGRSPVLATVSAHVARTILQIVANADGPIPSLILRQPDNLERPHGVSDHALPMVTPKRSPHILHLVSSVREHAPIGMLPEY